MLYVYLVEEQYSIGEGKWASRILGAYTTQAQAERQERLHSILLDEQDKKNGGKSETMVMIKTLEVHNKFEDHPEFNHIRKPEEWITKYGM